MGLYITTFFLSFFLPSSHACIHPFIHSVLLLFFVSCLVSLFFFLNSFLSIYIQSINNKPHASDKYLFALCVF